MKKTKLFMDTVVEICVFTETRLDVVEERIDRAFEAFRKVESACSRFDPNSELMMLCSQVGVQVSVSPLLFEPLQFAIELAKWTDGIFDPTIGATMEGFGFNRNYLTRQPIHYPIKSNSVDYLDIELNTETRNVCLKKPLVIDLGAVAKGFAIDLAVQELKVFERFIVNAGGDIYAGGADESTNRWNIGIQHPAEKDQIIHMIEISNEAICTSGSYERKSTKNRDIHHIIDPKSKRSPRELVSCSIIAPYAMLADALSTATLLLGANRGKTMIEEAELKGIMISEEMQIINVGGS